MNEPNALSRDEMKALALLQSHRKDLDLQSVGFPAQSPPGMEGSRSLGSSLGSLLLPLQASEQALRQNSLDGLSINGMSSSHHLSLQEKLVLMELQHQRQLQQQEHLLLQASGLGSIGFGGMNLQNLGARFVGPGMATLGESATQAAHPSLAPPSLAAKPLVSLSTERILQRRSESFPMTLHRLLADLEAAGASHIATFVGQGDAFLIKNPKMFEEIVISDYFPRMGSFGSFQRQLNLYDFKRISYGPHRGAYKHSLFTRQYPLLAREMKRTKIKGKAVKKIEDSNEKDTT